MYFIACPLMLLVLPLYGESRCQSKSDEGRSLSEAVSASCKASKTTTGRVRGNCPSCIIATMTGPVCDSSSQTFLSLAMLTFISRCTSLCSLWYRYNNDHTDMAPVFWQRDVHLVLSLATDICCTQSALDWRKVAVTEPGTSGRRATASYFTDL